MTIARGDCGVSGSAVVIAEHVFHVEPGRPDHRDQVGGLEQTDALRELARRAVETDVLDDESAARGDPASLFDPHAGNLF